MILDHINNSGKYDSLHPAFKLAFEKIKETTAADFEKGKLEIDGDSAFLLFFNTEGKGTTVKLECHRKYIDIHYVFEGSDLMGYKERGLCSDIHTDAIEKDDYKLFNDRPVSEIMVDKGYFTIFFPEDAHAPLMGSGKFLKIVAKIKVN